MARLGLSDSIHTPDGSRIHTRLRSVTETILLRIPGSETKNSLTAVYNVATKIRKLIVQVILGDHRGFDRPNIGLYRSDVGLNSIHSAFKTIKTLIDVG